MIIQGEILYQMLTRKNIEPSLKNSISPKSKIAINPYALGSPLCFTQQLLMVLKIILIPASRVSTSPFLSNNSNGNGKKV